MTLYPPIWQGKLLFPKHLPLLWSCSDPRKPPKCITLHLAQTVLYTHAPFLPLSLSCRGWGTRVGEEGTVTLSCMCGSHMRVCIKFSCFLLLICVVSVWLLDQPKEPRPRNVCSSRTVCTLSQTFWVRRIRSGSWYPRSTGWNVPSGSPGSGSSLGVSKYIQAGDCGTLRTPRPQMFGRLHSLSSLCSFLMTQTFTSLPDPLSQCSGRSQAERTNCRSVASPEMQPFPAATSTERIDLPAKDPVSRS